MIFASIIGFFLIGMIGANVYEIIELFRPGSYSMQSGKFTDPVVTLYYSFVTITIIDEESSGFE